MCKWNICFMQYQITHWAKKRENSTTMDNEYFSKSCSLTFYVCLNFCSSKKNSFSDFSILWPEWIQFSRIFCSFCIRYIATAAVVLILYTYCSSAFWKLNRIILCFKAQLFAKENFFTWFQLNFISEFFKLFLLWDLQTPQFKNYSF